MAKKGKKKDGEKKSKKDEDATPVESEGTSTLPDPEPDSEPEAEPTPEPEPAPEKKPDPIPETPPSEFQNKPRVPLKVFCAVSGKKWDQLAGFQSYAKREKLGPLTIPEWQAEFQKFANKPTG